MSYEESLIVARKTGTVWIYDDPLGMGISKAAKAGDVIHTWRGRVTILGWNKYGTMVTTTEEGSTVVLGSTGTKIISGPEWS